MTTDTIGVAVGVSHMLAWRVDDNGYAIGTASSLANGSTSSAYYLKHVKSAAATRAQLGTIEQRDGSGRLVARVPTGDRLMQPFDVVDAVIDGVFGALVSGGGVDSTDARYPMWSDNPLNDDAPAMGIALMQKFFRPGSVGGKKFTYVTTVFPSVQIEVGGSELPENAASNKTYRVTPSPTTVDYNGVAFEDTGLNLTDNRTDAYYFTSEKPVHIVSHRVASTDPASISLPYLPVADSTVIWRNGTKEAPSAVNTATGVVTAASGTSGQMLVVLYQTEFKASPTP